MPLHSLPTGPATSLSKPKYKRQKRTMLERHSVRGIVPTGKADTEYGVFLSTLDPRGKSERGAAVRYSMAICNDRRFNEFLSRLSVPAYARYSLQALAKSCDISLQEFADFWRKAQNMQALSIATEAMPALATDLVSDSRTKSTPCDRCDGFGWAYVEDGLDRRMVKGLTKMGDRFIRVCPACDGSGKGSKPGDSDSRHLLLEMTGMISKRGAAAVQITQNFGGAGMESAVGRMAGVSFSLDDDAIDVEPVKDSSDGSS